jgi:hypothetical protein
LNKKQEIRMQLEFLEDAPNPEDLLKKLISDCFKFRSERSDLPKFVLGRCVVVNTDNPDERLTGPDAQRESLEESPKKTRGRPRREG